MILLDEQHSSTHDIKQAAAALENVRSSRATLTPDETSQLIGLAKLARTIARESTE